MSIKIDKSLFTPEELDIYKSLIAKATVNPEEGEDTMEEEVPETPRKRVVEEETFEEEETEKTKKCATKKSADPAMTAALAKLANLEKSLAMQEMTAVAKRYAALGEDEDELAHTLYEMKKSNEANYEAYIDVLEKSLDLLEKSGIFAEIGKSGSAYGMSGSTIDKVEAIASEIRKSNPEMSYEGSVAKAWEQNPELIAEYEAEYNRRK